MGEYRREVILSATSDLFNKANRLLNNPYEIDANPSRSERKKIQQYDYRADNLQHKTALLCYLLKKPDATKSIIFVRKRERAHELVQWLQQAKIKTWLLEGEMVQAKRTLKRLNA